MIEAELPLALNTFGTISFLSKPLGSTPTNTPTFEYSSSSHRTTSPLKRRSPTRTACPARSTNTCCGSIDYASSIEIPKAAPSSRSASTAKNDPYEAASTIACCATDHRHAGTSDEVTCPLIVIYLSCDSQPIGPAPRQLADLTDTCERVAKANCGAAGHLCVRLHLALSLRAISSIKQLVVESSVG